MTPKRAVEQASVWKSFTKPSSKGARITRIAAPAAALLATTVWVGATVTSGISVADDPVTTTLPTPTTVAKGIAAAGPEDLRNVDASDPALPQPVSPSAEETTSGGILLPQPLTAAETTAAAAPVRGSSDAGSTASSSSSSASSSKSSASQSAPASSGQSAPQVSAPQPQAPAAPQQPVAPEPEPEPIRVVQPVVITTVDTADGFCYPVIGGTADPGAALSVTVGGSTLSTTADGSGRWSVGRFGDSGSVTATDVSNGGGSASDYAPVSSAPYLSTARTPNGIVVTAVGQAYASATILFDGSVLGYVEFGGDGSAPSLIAPVTGGSHTVSAYYTGPGGCSGPTSSQSI
ncbi:MAG: hypothetical protein LBM23_08915 [Propionibacteriaceae bacterium]|nr:hypothetical protein [Propionibacteriaceae bacterium]